MHSKLIKGCSSIQGDENLAFFRDNCLDVMSLEDMLTKQFKTDAHFTSYRITDYPRWPRLNLSILPEIRQDGRDVVLSYLTFDWDNADHAEWTNNLLAQATATFHACQDPVIKSWSAIYTTAHGMRLIYKMSRPVPVDEAQQHLAWMFHHFKENGFDRIDEGCKDWTRLMRCPQVIRDGKATWQEDYYGLITQDVTLDMDAVGKKSAKSVATKTYFHKDKLKMPDHGTLSAMLVSKSNGREKQTDYKKRAKKVLKDTPYVDILFNDATPHWPVGSRNDEILKMLGVIVPILLRKVHASAEQIFALAIEPLLTLDNDKDWQAHGWNALLDIYEREVNRLNFEKEQQAEKVSEELELLDKMAAGMKEWCDDPELHKDEESARQHTKSNCLLSAEKYFYIMDENGRFPDFVITQSQLISRIRKTYLDKIIDTTKINFTGEVVDMPVSNIVNQYSSPVAEIHMRPVCGAGGFVENLNGDKPVLVLSTFCRNDDLEPEWNEFVDQWLRALGGEHYEALCNWIAWALALEEGLICALSMEGASNAGKKLLTEGLAECLKHPYVAGPEAMYHQSSAFLKTPFLVVNEAWPKISGATSPADKFKSITGGDGIIVNEKFKPSVRVLCPVRLIMCANDDGIIRELISGKDMGVDNRTAIGERLYHFKVSRKAELFLKSIGGRAFTAKKGQRWIRPDSGADKSDFVVAKHFLYLYNNRKSVDPSQRFLVMGNCSPGAGAGTQTIIERLLADNNHTPLVARAIREMVDSKGMWGKFVVINKEHTRIWVTRHGIQKYIKEVLEERVSGADIYSGLLNLMVGTEPDDFGGANHYEVSAEILSMIASEQGIAKTYLRNIYMNRISGGLST
jgi:hypothetical protein